MRKQYLFLFIFLLLGCEPDIKIQKIAEQKAYLPITIGFNVSTPESQSQLQPEVKLVNKYNLENKIPVVLSASANEEYAFNIAIRSLDAGEYRLIITTPYRQRFLGIPLWRSHKVVWQDFIVHKHLPYTCFTFDNKDTAINGWKSTHVFIDNKDKPVSPETCPGLFFVENSWPWSLDTVSPGGSLFVPVSSECFPKTSSQVTNQGRWMFSVLSPDLSQLAYWQNIHSIQFRIATKNINITVKPALHVQNGELKSTSQLSEPEQPSFEISSEQWRTIEFPVTLQKGMKVMQFELHISGIPEQTVSDTVNSIFIDGVCPIQ